MRITALGIMGVLCAQDGVLAQTAKAIAAQSFPSVVLLLMQDQKGQPISIGGAVAPFHRLCYWPPCPQ
jgi:hypothetical protein